MVMVASVVQENEHWSENHRDSSANRGHPQPGCALFAPPSHQEAQLLQGMFCENVCGCKDRSFNLLRGDMLRNGSQTAASTQQTMSCNVLLLLHLDGEGRPSWECWGVRKP